MEPLSITTGCVSLLGGLAALSKQITSFALLTHGARADMDAFSKEILALTLCLDALRQPELIRFYPDSLRPNLITIIRECNGVAGKMRKPLSKFSSGTVTRRMQWSFTARDETDRLRQSLEAHKSALQIAVSLVSLSATQSLQNDTSSIRAKAALLPGMKRDLAQIEELRAEIAALRIDVNLQRTGLSIPMQRFLEESTAYANSVCDEVPTFDGRAIRDSTSPLLPDVLRSRESNQQPSATETHNIDQAVSQGRLEPNPVSLPSLISTALRPGRSGNAGNQDRNFDSAKEVDSQPYRTLALEAWAARVGVIASLAWVAWAATTCVIVILALEAWAAKVCVVVLLALEAWARVGVIAIPAALPPASFFESMT
jgi:hypothetical protein